MTLAEVLKDKANYPDAVQWQLGNGVNVTLGQLRELDTASRAAIVAAEKKNEERAAALAAQDEELKKAQLNTAAAYQALQKAKAAIQEGRMDDPILAQLFGTETVTPPANRGGVDPYAALDRLEGDTVVGPLVKALKLTRAEALETKKRADELMGINTKMAEAYLNDRLDDIYEKVVPEAKKAKFSQEALIQHAVKNKQFTRSNVPDLRKAYADLSAADREADKEAELRVKITAELEEKYANAGINVPRPGGNIFGLDTSKPAAGKAGSVYKNLDEAFAAAAADKDLWSKAGATV